MFTGWDETAAIAGVGQLLTKILARNYWTMVNVSILQIIKTLKFLFRGVNSPNRGWFKLGFGGDLIGYYQIKYDKEKYIPINKGHFFD